MNKACRYRFFTLGATVPVALVTLAPLFAGCSSQAADDSSEANVIDGVDPAVVAAARANLARIEKEIDRAHLANYSLEGAVADQFVEAVKLEYGATPKLLASRMQTLASMVFFSAPEVKTDPAVGKVTPFHGLDDAGFNSLMASEDVVFNHHMQVNGGSPKGVRPFSVCETKFLVGIAKGENTDAGYVANRVVSNYDGYAKAFASFAQTKCEERDLKEWYNFRGLGGLRPSWLESNISERFIRRMLKACKSPAGEYQQKCAEFNADRLKYRDKKNTELAMRTMMFDPRPEAMINGQQAGAYMVNPSNPGVLVEDRNGDGIGEWVAPGSAGLAPNAEISTPGGKKKVSDLQIAQGKQPTVQIQSTGQFGGNMKVTVPLADGTQVAGQVAIGSIQPIDAVDPAWKKDYLGRPDLGLMQVFSDGSGCSSTTPSPDQCPLLKRFYSMIDRHENFYQTYSGLDPSSSNVSQQPSPLVACSITLAASHAWDHAGTPEGGVAGFIYLMRVPFDQILTSDARSIDTLGLLKDTNADGQPDNSTTAGPKVLRLADVYAGSAKLDMSQVWLDIATLSNNQYESEHEVSKYGSVPAEQIEGMLVVRRPAAMTAAAPPTPPPAPPPPNNPDQANGAGGGHN